MRLRAADVIGPPEDDNRALEPVGGHQGKSAHVDLDELLVANADMKAAVRRQALAKRHREGKGVGRHQLPELVERAELRGPLLALQPSDLLEAAADQLTGRVVEKDHYAVGIDDEGGQLDSGDEVPRQYELERLRSHGGLSVTYTPPRAGTALLRRICSRAAKPGTPRRTPGAQGGPRRVRSTAKGLHGCSLMRENGCSRPCAGSIDA